MEMAPLCKLCMYGKTFSDITLSGSSLQLFNWKSQANPEWILHHFILGFKCLWLVLLMRMTPLSVTCSKLALPQCNFPLYREGDPGISSSPGHLATVLTGTCSMLYKHPWSRQGLKHKMARHEHQKNCLLHCICLSPNALSKPNKGSRVNKGALHSPSHKGKGVIA